MEKLHVPNRWEDLQKANLQVIACATVIEEMLPFLPEDVPYEVLDFGLHLWPEKLKIALQEKVNESSQNADVLLIGFGLCSMAIIGLKATTATLVIPRVDDCIAIFLGSCEAYKAQAKTEPGTYYLTKGWIEVGDNIFEEHKRMVERFGEEKAQRMTQLMLKRYKRIGFINTGQYDLERYRAYAREKAEKFGLRFEEIKGSPALVKKMIHGPWDEEFLVVSPGQTIRYQDFANSNPK
ncbi:MAG: DUF1638 domain-containing protein [Anaerolineales bacterium]|jgi:hypothetical protein